MNVKQAETALRALVSTINNVGGVTHFQNANTGGPACDPYWCDLGDAYLAACAALVRAVEGRFAEAATG